MEEGKAEKLIVWNGLISATKNRENALKGNVIFEISLSLKCAMELGDLSRYPIEEEVILPYPFVSAIRSIT